MMYLIVLVIIAWLIVFAMLAYFVTRQDDLTERYG